MLLYTAGPYSGDIDANIARARRVAVVLWEVGHAVICPHLNSAHMEQDCKADYETFMAGDFNMIARCDGMVMLPGWEESRGAVREHAYAVELDIPIWIWPDYPKDLHVTEIQSPIQCQGFREKTGQMYRLHLSKNADYSPANIMGPGEQGLATRMWDKITRMMNLVGFKVFLRDNDRPKGLLGRVWKLIHGRAVVIEDVWYSRPKTPKHESLNDTLKDTAVYALIYLLFREGRWGR